MTPRLCIIATLLNEQAGIDTLLRSISNQTTLPDEVVFCDAGSTDLTVAMIERWAHSTPFPVRLIVAPGANISEGRNTAISAATSEVIAVTDGGCELDPEWLDRISAPLTIGDPPFDVAYGATVAQGDSAIGVAFAALHSVLVNRGKRVGVRLLQQVGRLHAEGMASCWGVSGVAHSCRGGHALLPESEGQSEFEGSE